MWTLASFCTHEMLSTPPATYTSPSPAMMRCAAVAMVCRPDEQKRLMVMPEVVIGQPARSAIWRALLEPVPPSGLAQPITTSSTSPAPRPARAMACCTAWPQSVARCGMLKAPLQLLASGARAVETMTAPVMVMSLEDGRETDGLSRRRRATGVAQELVIEADHLA